MLSYVLRRLVQSIPILFGVALLVFLIVYLAPGDPTDRFRTPRVSAEQIEQLRLMYGLDQPLHIQFFKWITTFVQVWKPEAWGYSFLDGQPVLGKIIERVQRRCG